MIFKKYALRFFLYFTASVLIFILAAKVLLPDNDTEHSLQAEEASSNPAEESVTLDIFGLPEGDYVVEEGVVGRGQTLSHILESVGFSHTEIDRIAREMSPVFNPRRIRRGNNFFSYYRPDSTDVLRYFIYEISDLEYVKLDFQDSVRVKKGEKEVTTMSREASGIINYSLWDTMLDNDLHPELVIEMSKILAWSVDFYRIDSGDRFKVLFNEQYVGDDMVGVEQVKAIYFMHRGKEIEGYYFEKDTVSGYFAPDGENLRKMFLQAPLEFGRISSRYSHSRVHPIHGDRRPHYGTDYAAPRGTPILAVGDGVVTRRAYTRGNGYYVRIRHNAVYETQYLHLSRFADGINEGTNVSQGDVIGYVGSTGMATGPHVCFRFWENGRQVDHLRLDLPSGEPLPEAYMDEFVKIRDQYKAVLDDIVFEEAPSV